MEAMAKIRHHNQQKVSNLDQTPQTNMGESRSPTQGDSKAIGTSPRRTNSTNGGRLSIDLAVPGSTPMSSQPPSPLYLTPEHVPDLPRSTSFQDAQVASVAQLLDVIHDLERAHAIYERREREKARGSISGGKFV